IQGIKSNLRCLEEILYEAASQSDEKYKQAAIDYLRYLYDHDSFLETCNDLALEGLKKLHQEAVVLNHRVRQEYFTLQAKVNSSDTPDQKDSDNLKLKEKQFVAHTYMMEQLRSINFEDILNDNPPSKTFNDMHIS